MILDNMQWVDYSSNVACQQIFIDTTLEKDIEQIVDFSTCAMLP